MRPRSIIALVAVATCAGAGFFYFRVHATLSDVAHAVLTATLENRTPAILARLDPQEKLAFNMNDEKLQRLIGNYVLPEFAKCQPVGKPIESGDPAHGLLNLEQPYVTAKGAKAAIGCTAVMTPDGIICQEYVSGLILSTMIAKYAEPTDTDRHAIVLRAIRADKNSLTQMGYDGMWSPERNFQSWSDLEAFHESRIRRRQSQPSETDGG